MAIEISQLVGPNADAGNKAIKSARRGDRSQLAERLRDPAVTLLDCERSWLADEITGKNRRPPHRGNKTREEKHSQAFKAWAHYYKCLCDLKRRYSGFEDAKLITLAKKDAAAKLKITVKTLNTQMAYFDDPVGTAHLLGAEVCLMTDEEYAIHLASLE